MQLWVLANAGLRGKFTQSKKLLSMINQVPIAIIKENANNPFLESEGRLDPKYINKDRLDAIYELPYSSDTWIIDYYLKKRDFNPKTVAGVLEDIGIHLNGEKTFKTQQISLIAYGVSNRFDTICLLNLSGNFYDNDTIHFLNLLLSRLGIHRKVNNVSITLSDDEIIKLADELNKKSYEIAMTTIDIENIELRFRSIRDLFNSEVMQKIDNIYHVKTKIEMGKWKAIAFYNERFQFYLYLSKARKSKFKIQLSYKEITPNIIENIFNELASTLSIIKNT